MVATASRRSAILRAPTVLACCFTSSMTLLLVLGASMLPTTTVTKRISLFAF
jgi:hypothetical protein